MLIQFEKQADVAREYRVSQQVIASLVLKAKKKKEYLRGILDARELKDDNRKLIRSTVEELNSSNTIIDSI